MIEVGEIYKVRNGYSCIVGCNVFEAGKVLTVTDSNVCVLGHQEWKLEKHVHDIEDKMMKRGRGRPPKLQNK